MWADLARGGLVIAQDLSIGQRVVLEGIGGTVDWISPTSNDCAVVFDDDGQRAYVDPSELVREVA